MADTDDDILEEAKELFAEAEDAESENRERALASLKFGRMGEQWTDADKTTRKDRPCLTINRMPSFVRQVVNDSRQNKPGIKVHPVDSSGDPETAEVLNGVIRNIEVQSDAEVAYDTAIDNAASAGFGYLRVDLDPTFEDSFDLDIKIRRIANPFSVYGDPNSIEADSSDWRTAFVTETLTEAEFKAKYPDAKETIGWDGKGDGTGGWKDSDDIRVAEYWTRREVKKPIVLMSDGSVLEADYLVANKDLLESQGLRVVKERDAKFWKVTQRIITGVEVLETVDWAGKYIPIVPVYGEEVNVEGRRQLFSLIHWGMDPQRIYNYGRSAAIEAVALQPKAPFVGPVGSFDVDPNWLTANSQNHATLEYDPQKGPPPQRQMPPQPSTGWMAEVKVASDDMKSAIGMFNASMGERSNETSGKAIVSRKIEGDISTFHFIDNLSRGIRHTGRIIVDLIPKVYDRPRMVRILGEDRKESRMVKVGPKPPAPPMPPQAMAGGGGAMQPPPVMAGAPPMPPAPPVDPRAAAMDKVYDLTVGKYDVTVSAGPSFTSRREEAATQMLEMLRSFPALGPIIGDLVAKNLDWPGADEIADRIVKFQESQQQGQQAPKGPPPRDTVAEANIKAGATIQAAEVKAKAGIVETQIETNAKQQTDAARIAAEQQAATQSAAASVMAGQRPPELSPGGNIAR